MKESEKAKELVEKFYTNMENTTELYQSEYKLLAKQCAFICVEEMIKIVPSVYLTTDGEVDSGHSQYYQNVKTEIEKL